MATEVASAYVSIGASTKGLGKAISKQFSAVEGQADQSGSRIASSLGGAFSTVTKIAAGAVAIVGGSLVALAAKGGFDRALALDNANAKMKALGYSADTITSVMNTALGSVKGTAFGLGDAASLATQLLASGIKPGEALARALGNTADLAAVANTSIGDLSPVMGQLASSSHLYTQDLLQLNQRGLPVFGWLADSLGTTQGAIRDMVSAGDISFSQLQTAIEQNIGGAAKATDSFQASWMNVKAALSRSGAAFAVPGLGALKGIFDAAIPVIDRVTASLQPLSDALFAKVTPALQVFTDAVSGLSEMGEFSGLLGGLNDIGTAISYLIDGSGSLTDVLSTAFGTLNIGNVLSNLVPAIQSGIQKAADWLANGGIQMLAQGFLNGREALFGAVMKIVPAVLDAVRTIGPSLGALVVQVVGSLAALAPKIVDTVAAILPQLLSTATDVFGSLITAVVKVLPLLLNTLTSAIPQIISTLTSLIPQLIDGAVSLFMALVNAVPQIIPPLLTALVNMLPSLITSLLGMIPTLLSSAVTMFQSLITALITILPDLLDTLLTQVLPALLTTLLDMIPQLLQAAIDTFVALVDALVTVLPMLIDTLIGQVLPTLIETLIGMVPQLIEVAIQVFMALVSGLIKVIPALLGGLWDAIGALIGALFEAIPQLMAAAVDLFAGIGQGFKDAWPAIWDWLKSVPRQIIDSLGNVQNMLKDAGLKILEGLVNGLKSGFTKVKDTLGKLTDLLPSWKGPAEVDARLLTGAGRTIMQSLVSGFEDGAPSVEQYLRGFTSRLALAGSASVNVTGSATAPSSAGGGAGDLGSFARMVAVEIQALTRSEAGSTLDSAIRAATLAKLAGTGTVVA